jgi:hypothetical protein
VIVEKRSAPTSLLHFSGDIEKKAEDEKARFESSWHLAQSNKTWFPEVTITLPVSFAGILWVECGGFLGRKLVGEARKTLGTRIGHKLELQNEYVAVEEVSCLGHSICRTNHCCHPVRLRCCPHISPKFSTRPMRAIYESSSLAGHGWRECQTLCRCQRCLNASEFLAARSAGSKLPDGRGAPMARCLDRTRAGLRLSRDYPARQPCDSWQCQIAVI